MSQETGCGFRRKFISPTTPKDLGQEPKDANDIRNVLLVAATLIAATTFSAGVNPPGGVWQEDSPDEKSLDFQTCLMPCPMPCLNNQTCLMPCLNQTCLNQKHSGNEKHRVGQAVYSAQPVPFHFFLICNTLALSTSLVLLISITFGCPFFLEVLIATLSMAGTYGAAIFCVTPHEHFYFRLIALVAAGPLLIRFLIWILPKVIKYCK